MASLHVPTCNQVNEKRVHVTVNVAVSSKVAVDTIGLHVAPPHQPTIVTFTLEVPYRLISKSNNKAYKPYTTVFLRNH